MSDNTDSAIHQLTLEVGKLTGALQSQTGELSRLNAELVRLGAEQNRKHEQNVMLIQQRHEQSARLIEKSESELSAAINSHQMLDNSNFSALNIKLDNNVSATNMIRNLFIGGCTIATIIWGIIQFIAPYVTIAPR